MPRCGHTDAGIQGVDREDNEWIVVPTMGEERQVPLSTLP